MRIITGDECGLIKECIPELSRPLPENESSKHPTKRSGSGSGSGSGNGSGNGNGNGSGNGSNDVGVFRLNGVDQMCRSRGIIDLAFCQNRSDNDDDDDDDSSSSTSSSDSNTNTNSNSSSNSGQFHFCALRADGTLEQWEGIAPNQSKHDKLCGGLYKHVHTVKNVFDEFKQAQTSTLTSTLPSTKTNTTKSKGGGGGTSSSICSSSNDSSPLPSSSSSSSSSNTTIGRPIALCTAYQYQYPNFTNNNNSNNINRNSIVACCSSTGIVSILDSNKMDKGVIAQYSAYMSKSKSNPSNNNNNINNNNNNNNNAKLGYIKGNFMNRDIATAMAMDYKGKRVAVGGRERAATMLDVETGAHIWKAKNLPHNPQTLLQQPIWSTAIQFLSPNDTTTQINNINTSDLLAVGTAYKQLQIYDVRADAIQRRPVLYTPEWDSNKENLFEHRITSLCQLDCNTIAVGDSAGFIHAIDLRKVVMGNNNNISSSSSSSSASRNRNRSIAASVGRFSGPAGSVRQIVKHENSGIIACVGLDRMMRTYDIRTRKQLDCVYLKQRLNCMLFCGDDTWTSEEDIHGVEDNFEEGVTMEGDINDEDEVIDYVDSSAEEMSDDDDDDGDDDDDDDEEGVEMEGKSSEELSESNDKESESDECHDDSGSDDGNSSSSDENSVTGNANLPKAKRRRR